MSKHKKEGERKPISEAEFDRLLEDSILSLMEIYDSCKAYAGTKGCLSVVHPKGIVLTLFRGTQEEAERVYQIIKEMEGKCGE